MVKISRILRENAQEIGGSLGDLGILIPLAILLIVNNGLSPVTVFFFVGLHYLITGYYFKIPLPIQPLKAATMIAIATGASPQLIGATGILMGAILLILTFGKAAILIGRIFTKPIVRGIQLAVGLFLTQKGLALIMDPPDTLLAIGSAEDSWISILLAVFAGVAILLASVYRKIPATLVIIPIGVLIGLVAAPVAQFPSLESQFTLPLLLQPSWDDFVAAFFLMVIPQIPLTFANSIVSTHYIAHDYFGERAKRVTPRSLCTSLGIGNLIGGFFGAMPCCHGAGGLTAHYSFGARSGRATIFLGVVFLVTGLLFGDSVYALFALIPAAILGALLIYVGVEHCMMIRDVLPHRQAAFVAMLIGGISVGTHNIAIGFAVGMVVGLLMKIFPAMMAQRNE